MCWWKSPYDPTGSTTYDFFAPNLQPDKGGPFTLFLNDVGNLILRLPLLFVILWPPFTNRRVDELYLFDWTVFALAWFGLWSVVQAPFILIILAVLIIVVIVVGILTWVHWFIFWRIFQGPLLQVYPRNLPPSVTPTSQIGKERWVYINGVATGQTILHQNLELLSKTFGTVTEYRPILGINNRTYGFLGDIIECILQRSFGFQTSETRLAAPILKDYLQNDDINRVILIAHSQGGILASHILDSLYTNLAGPDLRKLEVYTFANAALHFHNPRDRTTNTRAIEHIEHYCNEHDLVCSWGALSSNATPYSTAPTDTQFHGRVFVSKGATGHLLNQYYLSKMFPVPPTTVNQNPFLNETAIPDMAINDKFWVPRTGIGGPPGARVRDISRLHHYLNGQSP